MSQVINFFPRQTLMGDSAAAATYYSEIFDITPNYTIDAFLIAYGATAAANVSAALETTTDPTFSTTWENPVSFTAVNGATKEKKSASGLLRFVRVKVTVPAAKFVALEITGVAREST